MMSNFMSNRPLTPLEQTNLQLQNERLRIGIQLFHDLSKDITTKLAAIDRILNDDK